MQVWLTVLAVLAVSTTATFASRPHISWSIEDAPDLYNMGSDSDYIFKLVEGNKEYVSAESTRPQQLRFMLRETECLKSEKKQLDECDFKESAEMKACSAVFLMDPERNAIVINCDSPSPKRTRSRRAKWPPKCRRPGCYSSIGRFEPKAPNPSEEPEIPNFQHNEEQLPHLQEILPSSQSSDLEFQKLDPTSSKYT